LPVVRPSTLQGVEALRQAILAQARGQAQDLLREAQREVEGLRQRAEEDAELIRREILETARLETSMDKQRRIAAARLEIHRHLLARREKHIADVFDTALKQLQELRHTKAYRNALRRLTAEAAAALAGGELRVSANREDLALLDDVFLEQISQGLKPKTTLTRGEILREIDGGVIVETPDGRIRYDNTFSGRLERMRGDLRTEVYRILTRSA
jgi:V/A-type H+-transporting ATPase subunit E